MSAPIFRVPCGADVSIVANTPHSVLGCKAHANSGLLLKKIRYQYKGADATQTSHLMELCRTVFTTNGPGTGSTSVTPQQVTGRLGAPTPVAQFTAARDWTSEPTGSVVVDDHEYITPDAGRTWYDFPLGDEWDYDVSTGFVLRVTSPAGAATISMRAVAEVCRC